MNLLLSPDRPLEDPKDDRFGYAPFAESLAKGICGYRGKDGLVLALHGPWGSGKSTVLNFVKHDIEQRPEGDRPVVITFNPWWFTGDDDLARACLGHFQDALSKSKLKVLKSVAMKVAEYAEVVGGMADLTGLTGGAGGKIGEHIAKRGRESSKGVPALKAEISGLLVKADKRILVLVDDIDRLTPGETRQIFTVVKALADFPNVLYLLAFDRAVAVRAIEQQTGLPGDRFLEKILQVPFEMPVVDRTVLRREAYAQLQKLVEGTPAELCADWELFQLVHESQGIGPLLNVPRDVVRLVNTLSITYPAVRGEVNAVDFIALEAIRIFRPKLYDTIRAQPERFAGPTEDQDAEEKREFDAFHQAWANEVPEPLRGKVQTLVWRLFPKTGHAPMGTDLSAWRRALRASHPDCLPTYFRFMPPSFVGRRDIDELLRHAGDVNAFAQTLTNATAVRGRASVTKSYALLDRLQDHINKDIANEDVPIVIQALLTVADKLIDEKQASSSTLGEDWLAASLVLRLVQRLPETERASALLAAIRDGHAPATAAQVIRLLESGIDNLATWTRVFPGTHPPLAGEDIRPLKETWLEQMRKLSADEKMLRHPRLPAVLGFWERWASLGEVRQWVEDATADDAGLVEFLSRFVRFDWNDATESLTPRIQPFGVLKDYLDLKQTHERLQRICEQETVSDTAQAAMEAFFSGYAMMEVGYDPDNAVARIEYMRSRSSNA